MNFARTHRSLLAWMLCSFILFSGLACGLGHGQMLKAFSAADPAMDCGDQHGADGMDMSAMDMSTMAMPKMAMPGMDMAKMGEHALIMKMSMTDCAFAGTLTLSLLFFIGLGWLIRRTRPRLPAVYRFCRIPSRHSFPGLVPQAP
ncbi:DUF2946 domain-containing protein [Pseudomonas sp. Pseusp122]|uniref:DUF2946 domain-containing protein n=1 Tax=unclassified Pseudomonas TaxID=196821 RepID=UPI0039A5E15F